MFKYQFKKGFTLIELLVVVIILGLLASIALPSYMTSLETTKAREAITIARQWQAGRAIYFAENNSYPNNNLDLTDIGIDLNMNSNNFATGSQLYVLSNYYLNLKTNNKAIFEHKRIDDGATAIYIEATDTTLTCCAKTARNKKVCKTLSSSNSEGEASSSYSGYLCYDLGESD